MPSPINAADMSPAARLLRDAEGSTTKPRPETESRAAAKACTRCGVVKPLEDFAESRAARDGRLTACKTCEADRVRRYERERFPACEALGAPDVAGGLRAFARSLGFASAFELEVAARLEGWAVDAEREGLAFRYLDEAGVSHRWTPDFRTASGAAIEAKGRVTARDQCAIAAVLMQNPGLDLRLVLQRPHIRGAVEGSTMTPAEWAESLGLRWTTLDGLELVTMDLPRLVLTDEGDRIVPGWEDDGRPAERVAASLSGGGGVN